MNRLILFSASFLLLFVCAFRTTLPTEQGGFASAAPKRINWLSIEQAYVLTQKTPKKFVVDVYTDWCGWCIKLKKEVFDQPEFQEYAKKHLVMLELDFPRKKELPAKLKEQNDKLSEEFKVEGFPTILLMNARGKEIARTGYQEGGPAKYVDHLKELMK